jgi:N-sulfoglucosamine sulfohydrolase
MGKKNILLLIADDLGRMISSYGQSSMSTPNIDALAREGTLFEMAFTPTASCSPSRSVIYTGMHTHQNGMYGLHHDFHHFMTFKGVDTLPKLLSEAGYRTGIIGKVHVGPEEVYPWEVREESSTRDVSWVAGRAAAFFDQVAEDDRPFYLTVGFIDPHRDHTRAGFGNQDFPNVPRRKSAPEDMVVPEFLPDLPEVRLELANYSESVARMDYGVGEILKALRKAGLYEDTLIVFLSDNGAPFINSKTTLFDAGVHLPLIMRMPNAPAGVRNPNMVSFVDIVPTFLEWAGHTSEDPRRTGRSFLPILSETRLLDDWQEVYGSHTFHEVTNYWPTRYLRTPKFKYHRNVAWKLDFPFSADLYSSLTFEAIRRYDRRQEP